jgi:hypothetical protein
MYTDPTFFVYLILGICVFRLLQKIGKGIALREMIAVYSCLIYLLMPLLGYKIYTADNALARLWVKYMPVSESVYFGFVMPAILAFMLGMFMPSFSSGPDADSNACLVPILDRARETLKKSKPWIPLLVLGLFGYFFRRIISISVAAYFLSTFYLLLFSAMMCIYFSPGLKYKRWLITAIVLLIVYEAIQTGMFTIVVYMGVVIGSIIFIGTRIAFWKKASITALAVLFIILLQSTKGAFRKATWQNEYEGSKTGLFFDLMQTNFSNFNVVFDQKTFFPLYTRMNQGYNTALVMRRIPAIQDFDNGNSLYLTVASSLLPRVIWQDKLESGGVYNMKHFTGWVIKGWSTNIGPVGEAYGNFGVTGGIIYMFFFGLFIRFAYYKVLTVSFRYPLLLFWIPVFFFELSYSMENDTLQALNSLIKASIFVWVVFKLAPSLFVARKTNSQNTDENSHHIRGNRPGWSLPG